MFRTSEPAVTPSRSSTIRVLLALLLLTLAVNTLAAWQAFLDYSLIHSWLDDLAPPPDAQIAVLQRQLLLRVVSRLVVSAVLVLCAIFFVWQRRRSLSIHDELTRVQRLAHRVLENMAQGLVAVDGEHVVREINPAAARLLGADPGEVERIIRRRVEDLPAAGRELAGLVDEAANWNEPVWDRKLTIERDGLTLRLRADAHAIRGPDGGLGGCILLLRDLTHSLLVEERMRRMEKITGLGDAASGLVHEIKNPLTALSIHIQLLDERMAERDAPEEIAELIGVLKAEADRLNNALDGFWNYAHLEGLAVQPTDVIATLERIVQLIRPQAERQGVRVELRRPTAPIPQIPLDPDKFQQAVWNLAINALEAMPSGGDLVVQAADGDGALAIVVTDTGPGIPVEIREEIFKPYFTTKSHGTGLGLALAEKVVGQHHGGIACRTGPGGTSFHLSFPTTPSDEGFTNDGRRSFPHPDRG